MCAGVCLRVNGSVKYHLRGFKGPCEGQVQVSMKEVKESELESQEVNQDKTEVYRYYSVYYL